MKLRLDGIAEYLRSSLWFLPTICVAIAAILAQAALVADQNLDQEGESWFLFGGGVDGARSVVSTIATSMLTFTGLVFSVTMLVLQMASSQLSPRVMRTFLRDRPNQLVLGVFVATFVYALLVLRRITDNPGGDPFVPALSVWLAVILVLVSIGLFIFYIHHMAQAIRPVAVMQRVANETRDAIKRLYPEGIGDELEDATPFTERPEFAIVLSPRSGIVTAVDEEALVAVATNATCTIEFRACIGDFVREGAPLFTVRGPWDTTAEDTLRGAVVFGNERSMHQDAAFGLRQLVDIAVRALSPGINDPTTAVQSLDFIHDILGRLATRSMPSPARSPGGGAVILPRFSWADYVTLACDEIRRAGEGQIQVQRRMRAMLVDLETIAPGTRAAPLRDQLELLNAHLAEAYIGVEKARASSPSPQGHGPT